MSKPSDLLRWEESELNASPVLVEAAKDVIRQINEAEARLIDVVKSAKSALTGHAEQGLIDWSMPYNCEFRVLFNPGPTRRFYETYGEGEEPMRVPVCTPFRDLADKLTGRTSSMAPSFCAGKRTDSGA